jgi:hypothetical protein
VRERERERECVRGSDDKIERAGACERKRERVRRGDEDRDT